MFRVFCSFFSRFTDFCERFRESAVKHHALYAPNKNAPPKERTIIRHSIIRSTEEINEAQYVEHYACEGEKVPDHVGELESS